MLKHIVSIAGFCVLVPVIIGFKNYSNYGKDRKALTWFLVCSAVISSVSYYLWLQQRNNLPWLHAYTIIEFAFLSYIYSRHISPVLSPAVVAVIAGLFTLFSAYNSFFIQSLGQFNSYARGIEVLLIILYTMMFIYVLAMRNNLSSLRTEPMFWFNIGVLLYYTMSFFLFLLSNNMLLHLPKSVNQVSWAMHGFFLVAYYIFLSVALWLKPKH